MTVEDHDRSVCPASHFSQSGAQFHLLTRKELLAETPELPKGRGFDKNKRAGKPLAHSTEEIPTPHNDSADEMLFVHPNRGSSTQAPAGGDCLRRIGKQRLARIGIGVDEEQPIPIGRRRAAIAGASDLIDGFEHHRRSGGSRDGRRTVRGIVVAHDDLRLPPHARKHRRRRVQVFQRPREQQFLIKGGDDDGYLHSGG